MFSHARCVGVYMHMCTHVCTLEQGHIPSFEEAAKFLCHHRCLVLDLGRPGLVLPSPNRPALLTQGGRQMLPVSCDLTIKVAVVRKGGLDFAFPRDGAGDRV